MDWKLLKTSLLVKYVLCALLLYPSHGFPFATDSHRIINEQAAGGSQAFNPFLNDVLGLPSGLDTKVKSNRGVEKSILDWIGDGGIEEDRLLSSELLGGTTRSRRHFHHPLRPWNQAGLKKIHASSLYWAQDPFQSPGRKASWFDARDSYLDALTATTEQERHALFAETFQTLGQVMHLVADLASVPHTRDDAHPFAYSFESFVKKRPELITGFFDFDKSILSQGTGDPVATVPIARLWDTDTYDGTNPPDEANKQIALAEFAHANFFSRDTVRNFAGADPEFPLPAIDRLDFGPTDVDPRTGNRGLYRSKIRDGVPVTHMVRVSLFSDFAPFISFIVADDLVYRDYAQYLLPRAIGYSSGILDYFFRGKMDVVLAEDQPSETEVHVKVSNTTPGEDTMNKVAEVKGVLEYQLSGESEKFYNVSPSQDVTLTSTPQDLVFPLAPPPGAENAFLYVVYKGRLGLEEEAVMVGRTPFMDLKPKDPTLVCPDGSIQFTIVGGKPPYSWSSTKGEMTPDADTEGALLTPPDTGDVSGIAYRKFWVWGAPEGQGVGDGCYNVVGAGPCLIQVGLSFLCDGSPASFCRGGAVCPCSEGCTVNPADLGNGPKQYCASQFATFSECAGVPDDVIDFRTQAMLDAGCRPCEVEMQGGTVVTVTDADGQSADTTVMVE